MNDFFTPLISDSGAQTGAQTMCVIKPLGEVASGVRISAAPTLESTIQ